MSFYLGGMTITKAGWAGPQAVYLDFVTDYETGYLWQLYANRTLIGCTELASERRIIGQLVSAQVPAPLTLIRVDAESVRVNYGPLLPRRPWNRFALNWQAADYPADSHHFEITAGTVAGGDVDSSNVLALLQYIGDGDYQFILPALESSGAWKYGITPRDDALPLGNAGTTTVVTIDAVVPPPDVQFDDDGNRFTLSAVGGLVTADFQYGSDS